MLAPTPYTQGRRTSAVYVCKLCGTGVVSDARHMRPQDGQHICNPAMLAECKDQEMEELRLQLLLAMPLPERPT